MKQRKTIWASHYELDYKKSYRSIFVAAIFMAAILFTNTNAVANEAANEADSLSTVQVADTTTRSAKVSDYSVMTKSPSGALWRSFVVPGWGQVYNECYWKAPIFTVAWGVLGYLIYDNHQKYIDIKKITDGMSKDDPTYFGLRQERESYHDNRDLYCLYMVGVYSVAALDAYTGAHLFDFEVSDDLACKFRPSPFGVSLFVEF